MIKVSDDRTVTVRIVKTDFPEGGHGMCVQEEDNAFLVLLNDKSTEIKQASAFLHEMLHIWHDDFNSCRPINKIEAERHRELTDILIENLSDNELSRLITEKG